MSAEERFSSGNSNYTAKDIAVLEGIQAIRHRPGMYIGATSTSGLVHLLWEALDNAVDEAVAGWGQHIWVDVDREGIVRWSFLAETWKNPGAEGVLKALRALPAASDGKA